MDSYSSSVVALDQAFAIGQAEIDLCPCKKTEITADHVDYCIKCIRKSHRVPYFIEKFGRNLYGFRIQAFKAAGYNVSNPDQLIYDGEGNIIGISDVFNPKKYNPCEIKCLHKKCGFSINLKTLLNADRIVGRCDRDGYHLRTKEEIDHINQLKKEQGNGQIVLHENEEDHWKNYHNYVCVSGGHCHCMFDRNPMKAFRYRVMEAADRGNGRSVDDLVLEFIYGDRSSSTSNAVKPANSTFPAEVATATSSNPATPATP